MKCMPKQLKIILTLLLLSAMALIIIPDSTGTMKFISGFIVGIIVAKMYHTNP
jgi:hypothetical protein